MKISVILASHEQMNQAGVRIRYNRIAQSLKKYDVLLEVEAIQDVSINLKSDVYLISKCYDARVFVLACQAKQAGKLIGVDLFDDYFSQTDDPRFYNMRYWLKALTRSVSFILCSTPKMKEVAKKYDEYIPVHVMNDPASYVSLIDLKNNLRRKVEFAKDHNIINVTWFGMGDNPNFPVGLSDLYAYAHELEALRFKGFEIRLDIVTNQRAMSANNLSKLSNISVPYYIHEWSEDVEKRLLSRSLVCFLPVNPQSFSVAKSLNRAVTALTSGVQVLSVGYPLYDRAFSNFIYRDPLQLIKDLTNDFLLFNYDNAVSLLNELSTYANIDHEASSLASFFKRLQSKERPNQRSLVAVIHGYESRGEIHKFVQKRNALSVASPFCTLKLNFDVMMKFSSDGNNLRFLIKSNKISLVSDSLVSGFERYGVILQNEYYTIDGSKWLIQGVSCKALFYLVNQRATTTTTAAYDAVISVIDLFLKDAFQDVSPYVSERNKRISWIDQSIESL